MAKNRRAREGSMNDRKDTSSSGQKRAALSLDWWTVVVGVALAALVLAGLPAIPW
jgi:hypothetical protein